MTRTRALRKFWQVESWIYNQGDETIECRKVSIVVTRFPQLCMAYCHPGAPFGPELSDREFYKRRTLPAGTMMVREAAKVDGHFGSCYTCIPCLELAKKDMNGH